MQKEHQGSRLAKKFLQLTQKQESRLLLTVLVCLNFTQLLGFTEHNL